MMRPTARFALVIAGLSCGCGSTQQTAVSFPDTSFAGLVAQLSEDGGFFDTDNLISNERSYLHVLGELRQSDVHGGVYLGVGPDQNFSYIAEIDPEIAFMIDIRRDNLLEHLLFKALFAEVQDRREYLSMLVGRAVPAGVVDDPITLIVEAVDQAGADSAVGAVAMARVRERVVTFGIELSEADLATIERFHSAFINDGLDLRFNSFGRAPQPYYPTYRDLVLETDRDGNLGSFLSSESRFQVVRRLQLADRIIPVVGNLAGDHALRAISEYLNPRGMNVTAFYTSNVEFYLMGDGSFPAFARNLALLPADSGAVVIRSVFQTGGRRGHPQSVAGYVSTQTLQPFRSLLFDPEGRRGYWDLVTRDVLTTR